MGSSKPDDSKSKPTPETAKIKPTYISLVKFTDKGIQAAKQTTQRAAAWARQGAVDGSYHKSDKALRVTTIWSDLCLLFPYQNQIPSRQGCGVGVGVPSLDSQRLSRRMGACFIRSNSR